MIAEWTGRAAVGPYLSLGMGEAFQIVALADFHRAQRGEVAGEELAIEQLCAGHA